MDRAKGEATTGKQAKQPKEPKVGKYPPSNGRAGAGTGAHTGGNDGNDSGTDGTGASPNGATHQDEPDDPNNDAAQRNPNLVILVDREQREGPPPVV